jgi:hypothetical protein
VPGRDDGQTAGLIQLGDKPGGGLVPANTNGTQELRCLEDLLLCHPGDADARQVAGGWHVLIPVWMAIDFARMIGAVL